MKRIVIIALLLCTSILVNAQLTAESIFEKFSGKSGFTSISISPSIIKLAACFDDSDSDELDDISEKISSLQIIVSEEGNTEFTNDIRALVKSTEMMPIMEIREKGSDVNFYAKENDGIFSSLVMVALDEEDEVLMSISGKFGKNDLSKLGSSSVFGSNNDHIALLRKLEE